MNDVTLILDRAREGDAGAAGELLRLVYEELRRLATRRMAHEAAGTLQPTALVHEAWLRLGGDRQPAWQNSAHFFGAAAEAMRRILVDNARRKQRVRHGGGQERVDVASMEIEAPADDEKILAVHDAIDELAAEDALQAQVVKLRFFAGLTNEEASRALGISEKTVQRYWNHAKAWLYERIQR